MVMKAQSMGDNMYSTNGHSVPGASQDMRNMLPPTGVNGYPVSAAALLDPKSFKKQNQNGESQLFPFDHTSHSSSRFGSEPPRYFSSYPSPTSATSASKDDAYLVLAEQGRPKKSLPARNNAQSPMQKFDPKQTLNPKAFDWTKRQRDEALDAASTTESTITNAASEPQFVFTSAGDNSTESTSPEADGSGMGNLIEKVHNIEKREDRPHKRQKKEQILEDEEENKAKATFAGGGKGSEIGEYIRQKRKEGQQESGPTSAVVDLTAGRLLLEAHRVFPYTDKIHLQMMTMLWLSVTVAIKRSATAESIKP